MKLLLAILLLISSTYCMYEYQQGQYDWHIKTIGKLKEVFITQNHIHFQSEENLFGSLKLQTGNVLYSQGRNQQTESDNFLWNKQVQEYNQNHQSLYHNQDSIQIYNFKKNQFTEYIRAQLKDQLIDYIYQSDNTIYALTIKNLYITQSDHEGYSLKDSLFADLNENFVGLSQNNKQLYVISEAKTELCIKSLENQKKVCFQLNEQFTQDSLAITKRFVFYQKEGNPLIVDLESLKEVELGKYEGQKFNVERSQLIFSAESQKTISFLKIENGKLSSLYSIDKDTGSQYKLVSVDEQVQEDGKFFYINYSSSGFATLYKVANGQQSKIYTWTQDGPIRSVWKKQIEDQIYILVQNEDLRTSFYSDRQSDHLWQREESLAYITNLKFIDYTHAKERKVSSYHELLDERGLYNPLFIVPSVVLRVTGEFEDFVVNAFGFLKYLQDIFAALLQCRTIDDLKQLNSIGVSNDEYNVFYGLQKLMIIITEQNTIFRYESQSGNLVWRKDNELINSTYELLDVYDLEEREKELIHNELLTVYYSEVEKKVKIVQINPITGDLKTVQSHDMEKRPMKILKVQREFNDYLLILDSNHKGYTYPDFHGGQLLDEIRDKIIFYKFNQEENSIEGYRFFGNQVEQIWNLNFSDQETIIQIDSSYTESASPRYAQFDDKKILFKHIDYTNFAIITKNRGKGVYQGQGILNLYIINSRTGRVLFNHNQQLTDLSLPINMVYDQNAVFVSYFNPEQFLYEIWVVEAYSKDMVTEFFTIIEDYYISPKPHDDIFNYVEEDMNLVFLEQKYGFPKGIKAMHIVETKLSLTKRNLAIITQQNQIYSLDRNLLSTRRALEKVTKDLNKVITFDSQELPQYNYLLPLNFVNTLSYHLQLNGLNKIQFAPTNFESTSLFAAYGGDLFCSKVSPEKTFDILSEDFNYLTLLGTMLIVVILVGIMKKLVKKSHIFKIFHK